MSRGHKSTKAVTVELTLGEGDTARTLVTSVIPSPLRGGLTYFWLGTDVTRLRRLNADLAESQKSLEMHATAVSEYSVALKVILEQGRQERLDIQRAMRDNIDRLVLPMLGRLDPFLAGRPEASFLDAVRQTLNEITQVAIGARPDAAIQIDGTLTRRELEIARLVKLGESSDEIASALNISTATVSYHRKKIRNKLGLVGHKSRLADHLAANRGVGLR